MERYYVEPRTRKFVKGYGFLSFASNQSNKYGKQLLDAGINASIKIVHKAAEATREFLGNEIAEKIVKTKPVIDENSTNFEEIIILSEIIEMEHYKISKLLNDSTVLKFVAR